jgi:hypothetical protein
MLGTGVLNIFVVSDAQGLDAYRVVECDNRGLLNFLVCNINRYTNIIGD